MRHFLALWDRTGRTHTHTHACCSHALCSGLSPTIVGTSLTCLPLSPAACFWHACTFCMLLTRLAAHSASLSIASLICASLYNIWHADARKSATDAHRAAHAYRQAGGAGGNAHYHYYAYHLPTRIGNLPLPLRARRCACTPAPPAATTYYQLNISHLFIHIHFRRKGWAFATQAWQVKKKDRIGWVEWAGG